MCTVVRCGKVRVWRVPALHRMCDVYVHVRVRCACVCTDIRTPCYGVGTRAMPWAQVRALRVGDGQAACKAVVGGSVLSMWGEGGCMHGGVRWPDPAAQGGDVRLWWVRVMWAKGGPPWAGMGVVPLLLVSQGLVGPGWERWLPNPTFAISTRPPLPSPLFSPPLPTASSLLSP